MLAIGPIARPTLRVAWHQHHQLIRENSAQEGVLRQLSAWKFLIAAGRESPHKLTFGSVAKQQFRHERYANPHLAAAFRRYYDLENGAPCRINITNISRRSPYSRTAFHCRPPPPAVQHSRKRYAFRPAMLIPWDHRKSARLRGAFRLRQCRFRWRKRCQSGSSAVQVGATLLTPRKMTATAMPVKRAAGAYPIFKPIGQQSRTAGRGHSVGE